MRRRPILTVEAAECINGILRYANEQYLLNSKEMECTNLAAKISADLINGNALPMSDTESLDVFLSTVEHLASNWRRTAC